MLLVLAAGAAHQAAVGSNQQVLQAAAEEAYSPLLLPRPARSSQPGQSLAQPLSWRGKRKWLARPARPATARPAPKTQSAPAAAKFPLALTAPEARHATR